MRDIFDNEVQVGDVVAYIRPKYMELQVGKVAKLTPKGVTLDSGLSRLRYQIIKKI